MPETDSDSSANTRLDQAFTALANYDTGSARAGLVPIDEAVSASLGDPLRQSALEKRFIDQLARPTSTEAIQYICNKLRIAGSAAAVPALAALLTDPATGDAARGALEMLPDPAAGETLRKVLPRLSGTAKLGVIQALGHRSDPANVEALAPLLIDSDPVMVAAAASAMANLGTVAAAGKLLTLAQNPPAQLRLPIGHACLDGASILAKRGHRSEATALCRELTLPAWPAAINAAAMGSHLYQ